MADNLHNGHGYTGQPWYLSLLGPFLVSVVIPLCKFGAQQLIDWYARRVTARLARAGIVERRRQSRTISRTRRE